jgi:hypothetical protein
VFSDSAAVRCCVCHWAFFAGVALRVVLLLKTISGRFIGGVVASQTKAYIVAAVLIGGSSAWSIPSRQMSPAVNIPTFAFFLGWFVLFGRLCAKTHLQFFLKSLQFV